MQGKIDEQEYAKVVGDLVDTIGRAVSAIISSTAVAAASQKDDVSTIKGTGRNIISIFMVSSVCSIHFLLDVSRRGNCW